MEIESPNTKFYSMYIYVSSYLKKQVSSLTWNIKCPISKDLKYQISKVLAQELQKYMYQIISFAFWYGVLKLLLKDFLRWNSVAHEEAYDFGFVKV